MKKAMRYGQYYSEECIVLLDAFIDKKKSENKWTEHSTQETRKRTNDKNGKKEIIKIKQKFVGTKTYNLITSPLKRAI